jgi:hypothetical protein
MPVRFAASATAQLAGVPNTVGAYKKYDTVGFVATCRANRVTPHVAQSDGHSGGSVIGPAMRSVSASENEFYA